MWLLAKLVFPEVTSVTVKIKYYSHKHIVSHKSNTCFLEKFPFPHPGMEQLQFLGEQGNLPYSFLLNS